MKRLFLIFFLITAFSFAQQEHAWVYFKDKPGAQAAIADPANILSDKAIQRKSLRGTPIDERDVPVHEAYISQVKERDNILVKAKSKWMNCIHVIGDIQAISKLQELEFIATIDIAGDRPNSRNPQQFQKPGKKLETAIDFEYGFAAHQTQMLNTNYLHENDLTGVGISIAVIDAGFPNVNFTDAFQKMRTEGRLLGGYDFPNRSNDFNNPNLSNHGSLVLSTMAGYLEDRYTGTAPDASYYLFRTEIEASETPVEESYWVEAAERADSLGVDIINTSLGYTLYDNPDYSYTPEDMDGNTSFISRGASIATEKGLLVVVSAGNRGNQDYFRNIGAPADANVLSVGAVDKNRDYAFFSSIGPSADGRIKPDVAAQGQEVAAIDEFNNLVLVNGTSFSSPILAGSIASLWQANPSWTNLQIMQLVKDISSLSNRPDDMLGFGIPDFELALSEITPPSETDQLIIFPNPVSSRLKFSNPDNQLYTISLFDTAGQRLLKTTNIEDEIDLSGFSRGIYIAMFEKNNSTQSFLIIKK